MVTSYLQKRPGSGLWLGVLRKLRRQDGHMVKTGKALLISLLTLEDNLSNISCRKLMLLRVNLPFAFGFSQAIDRKLPLGTWIKGYAASGPAGLRVSPL